MKQHPFRVFGFAVLLATLVLPLKGRAQSVAAGSIQGRVTDPSGAVIPRASVTVRNADTGTTRELETNDQGEFRAVQLRPGNYTVTVQSPGFASLRRQGIRLEVGEAATINFRLELAGAAQTVTVTEDASMIDPEKTSYTATVAETAVENLPINGRRWENFVLLTPTVTPDGDFGLVSYRGISGLYNNNMVDGADNNQAFFSEARGRTRTSYTVSQAAIKEFQVGISNYSAEFGRAVGGTVNAVTKSGSNEFHGQAFYFLRDDAFNAAEPFSKAEGFGKLPERRQQYGFSMGGPIVQDRLFWFLNYDEQYRTFPGVAVDDNMFRDLNGTPFTDPAFDLTLPPFGRSGSAPICNFANVGQARCEGARQALLGELGPFNRKGLNNVALGKLDWVISPKHTLTGQYNFHKWRSPSGIQTQDRTNDTPLANGFDGVRTDLMLLRWTAVPTPTMVNEVRFQFGRDFEFQFPNAPGPSTTHNSQLDIDGGGMRDFLPRDAFPNEKRFQWVDNFSYSRGKHLLHTGVDINYVRERQVNLFRGGGVYDYRSFENFAKDVPLAGIPVFTDPNPARTGRHYNDFRQGFDLQSGGISRIFFSTTDINLYIQDTWKVIPNLTLNAALRYEYTGLPQPDQTLFENPSPEFMSLPAEFQALARVLHQDSNNFGPHVGLSWDVFGRQRTVVRAGYGLHYGRTSNSALSAGLFENNAITRTSIRLFPNSSGAPQYPNTFCMPALGTPGQASACAPPTGASGSTTFAVFAPQLVRPLIHMADLVVQQSISNDMTVSFSYLMSRGQRLPLFTDINLNPPNPADTVLFVDASGNTLGGPFPFYATGRRVSTFNEIIQMDSAVNSWYNAFVLRVNRRLRHGLQFDAHFTVSKALDDGQNSTTFFAFFSQLADPRDRKRDYGRSGFDIRKRFVANFYWEPPFNRIGNTPVRAILDGFVFSGILTLQDGRAFTPDLDLFLPSSFGGTSRFSGNGSGADDRSPWLGRNVNTTTGLATFDFRVKREFRLTERLKAEFIWEAFNLFNRTNFTRFLQDAFAATRFTRSGGARVITVEPEPDFLNPSAASNTLHGPREMQFAFKFHW